MPHLHFPSIYRQFGVDEHLTESIRNIPLPGEHQGKGGNRQRMRDL